jgi:hypothetical protein
MNSLLIISGILLIATKFADCYTTDVQITKELISFERNKIARFLFRKFGIRNSIWATWILTIAISVYTIYEAINNNLFTQISVLIIALFVSFVQAGVAYANYVQKPNFVTKTISRFSIYN